MGEGTLAQVLAGEATWCVVEGDCLEVLPTIPDRAVAHVITDPPYEAEAHTPQRRQCADGGIEHAPMSFAAITDADRSSFGGHAARIATRWALLFCQVEAVWLWRQSLVAGGMRWNRGQAWVKPDSSPQFNGKGPAQGFECIATAHSMAPLRWNGGGKRGVYSFECHRAPSDNSGHETQKPLPLMLELVALFTDPGELVLDAFAGSGTTGVACLRLGRRFIGLEKDPKYAAIARERLRAESQGLSLRDARAGQLPMFGETL